MSLKYRTGQGTSASDFTDLVVKVGDTLPIGTEVDYDGQTAPAGWQEVDDPNVYSTDETKIGTWIDGRPLYRKVLQTTQNITANTETTFSHGISNLRELCFYHFRFKASWSGFWAGESYMGKTGIGFRIYANDITIENNSTTAWQGCTYEFIMYYTKTTD